jgi:hypothetical protein
MMVGMKHRKRHTYNIDEFKLIGFSMENKPEGDGQVQVLTRAALTSDSIPFHHYIRSFANELDSKLRSQGAQFHLSQANGFVLLVKPDQTATLHVDPAVYLDVIARRAVAAGEAVFSSDIGDIRRGAFHSIKLRPEHRVVICLRVGWKFLLIFDLTPNEELDVVSVERTIAVGMRRLMFDQLYRSMDDDQSFSRLISRGWFPFNELIGAEYEELQKALDSDFNITAVEAKLLASFGTDRMAHLTEKWWRHPHFASRKTLLSEGVSLFTEGRHIPSIKTLISEIEGILRENHTPRAEGRQGMEKVLAVAFETVLEAAGGDSMYFPTQFVTYLRSSIFAPFDPSLPADDATRNTVGHGRASVGAYTPVRALQTILVLDQIYRFLTVPLEPDKPAARVRRLRRG